jgi:tryptophanyl-tRNA synthetase
MTSNKTKKISLTGDRPTGHLHLGHYVGSLKSRVIMQENYQCYIMIADTQALTDNFDNPEKVVKNVKEVCKDYIAVDIDPIKSTIFIQSMLPELPELTAYYMNIVTLSRLERNPTVKAELAQKGMQESIPVGFLCYPISKTADITAFKTTHVPVGDDQLPMIELSNEIVRRFNRVYKTKILKESKAILSKVQRLVGINGKFKASKSLNNAIFLSDSSNTIKEKIYQMYTDPNHLKISDKGKVEGNVVFIYLDAFYENKEELEDLKSQYQRGGLGDSTLKSLLNETLQNLITPIREKRELINDNEIVEILMEGTKKARVVAKQTLLEVKDAIGISYSS